MTTEEHERLRLTARTQFEEFWRSFSRWLFRVGVLALAVYVLVRSHTIVTTLIGAGILASAAGALALPLSKTAPFRQMKPHGRKSAAAAIALLLLIGMLVGIVMAFLKPFQDQANDLTKNWPTYQPQLVQKFEDFKNWYQKLPDWVHNQAPEQIRNLLEDKTDKTTNTGDTTPPSPTLPNTATHPGEMPPGVAEAVTGAFTGAFKNIGKGINSLVELILLPILAFYFLVDGKTLRNEFIRFFSERRQQRAILGILRESGDIMRAYLLAQLTLAIIAAVFVGGLLGILHIKYALILALIAGVTRVIPVIGPLLGFIPLATLVSVQTAQSGNYATLVGVLIAFTIMHLIESKVITPMILGHRLHLHPVVIIVVLLLGGEFFGLLGMFLAAPVTALVRTVLLHLYVYPRQPRRRGHKSNGNIRLRRALSAAPGLKKE
ncbi:MAG: AI-2E family transporter [Armatimonas sp.]